MLADLDTKERLIRELRVQLMLEAEREAAGLTQPG
jgi:hypothetical protein